MPDTPQMLLLSTLVALLGWCSFEDVRSRTIPHAAILSIVALYAIYAAAGYGDWRTGLAGAGILLLIGFILFHLNVMGGGDSKLIAALGLWTGLGAMGSFVFYTALAGGVVALLVLLRQRQRVRADAALAEARPTVPYGVAIAFGGTVAVWQSALTKAV
jgi:prepilin peptidase CpaA